MNNSIISLLQDRCRELCDEYNKAKESGNFEVLNVKALQISDCYNQLADFLPNYHTYRESAQFWKEKAIERRAVSIGNDNSVDKDFAESLRIISNITFETIAGAEIWKPLLSRGMILAEMKSLPRAMKSNNILLYGPPGTGKSMLVNALANAFGKDKAYYHASLDKLLSKYYSEPSKQIAALYDGARKNSEKAIIFIDDFDGMGAARSGGSEADTNNKVVTSFLLELDGTKSKNAPEKQPITIVACNNPWLLDSALLSRFQRQIYVPLPNQETTADIIRLQTKGYQLDLNLTTLAHSAVKNNYSGRDLEAVCSHAIEHMIVSENQGFESQYLSLPQNKREEFKLHLRPLNKEDFEYAFNQVHSPITQDLLDAYSAWGNNHN